MNSLQSLCILPSNAPSLGTECPKESPGLSSLESTPTVTRSTSSALHRDTRSHTIGGALQVQEKRRRKHNGAYSQDPLFTKAELNSTKYLTYREKVRRGGKKPQEEQIWTDELEEVFQLGMI